MEVFLSGLELIKISDMVFPGDHPMNTFAPAFQASLLKDGDVVFVFNHFWKTFVDTCIPHIKNKIKIILHGGYCIFPYMSHTVRDMMFFDYEKELLDNPYIEAIYACNCDYSHPKVHAIFIGLPRSIPLLPPGKNIDHIGWTVDSWRYDEMSYFFGDTCSIGTIMTKIRAKKDTDKLMYTNYTVCNTDNPGYLPHKNIRRELDCYLERNNIKKDKMCEFYEYIDVMKRYKFVLSPPGMGPDVFRFFESILVGTIPILFRSPKPLEDLWKTLPVLVIDHFWQINEKYLNEQYDIISSRDDYDFRPLLASYWREKIRG